MTDDDFMASLVTVLERAAYDAVAPLLEGRDLLESAAALHEIGDYFLYLSGEDVRAARAAGARWADVGVAFGISKQGAQQRFGRATTEWTD